MQQIRMAGSPREMGRQHGEQVFRLRPLFVGVLAMRLQELRRLGADDASLRGSACAALEEHDRPLLDFLAGLAEALQLPYADLLTYTLSSYLSDHFQVTHRTPPISESLRPDGCSTWAAAGRATSGGAPMLAKNRDYHADHIPLQLLARVRPIEGYRYHALGSAGSPHVFSSGINERGLAVADTHVLSTDIGPGLPRFSLMRALLEGHATTQSGVDYLRNVPHMGAGTLILADASGALAVCESGHGRCGYLHADAACAEPWLAATNHFVTPEMTSAWVENEEPLLAGNSQARRAHILEAQATRHTPIDVASARTLMSSHGSLLDALCRHPLQPAGQAAKQAAPGRTAGSTAGSTISSVLYLPRGVRGDGSSPPALWVAEGLPCAGAWELLEVDG